MAPKIKRDPRRAKALPEIVKKLITWREIENKMSQRQAVACMEARGFPVDLSTLQQWEQGRFRPGRLAAKALEVFLSTYPKITDAPVYGKHTKFSAQDIAEIRRLREEGYTMVTIAQRFEVDDSYISRILSGERLARSVSENLQGAKL